MADRPAQMTSVSEKIIPLINSPVEIIKDINHSGAPVRSYKYYKGDAVSALQRRRERNREMAKKSRLKKKQEVVALEQLFTELAADNEAIKAYLRQFPEELIRLEESLTTSSSKESEEEKVPSAVAMLEEDVELPTELQEIVVKLVGASFYSSLGGSSSHHVSTGSLKDLAVQAMTLDSSSDPQSIGMHTTTVLNTNSAALLVVNSMSSEYPIVYASPAFLRLTGYTVDEVIGRPCGSYLQCSTSDAKEIERLHVAITRGQAVCSTLVNCKKDRTTFVNEIRLAHFFDRKNRSCQIVIVLKPIKDFL